MNGFLSFTDIPLLLIIGFAILLGSGGGYLFQKLRIPQVVGYLAIGMLLGRSGLRIIGNVQIESLQPLTFFALGVMGFVIGSELHFNVLKKHGKQFMAILFGEGLGAFVSAGLLTAAAIYLFTHNLVGALALGGLLGAIASATAPAATVDVFWEYKTRGPLTSTVLAIVALDDALSLFLFAIASSVAILMIGESGPGLGASLLHVLYELGGAAVLGALAALILSRLLRKQNNPETALIFTVGLLATVLGLAFLFGTDIILSAMVLGLLLVNLAPRRSQRATREIQQFTKPIFVIFFVVVGARLNIRGIPPWIWGIAAVYVVGRTLGKMLGARFATRSTHAPATVDRYLGYCLFSQAGVAIGLSLIASARFSGVNIGQGDLGDIIITVVTATTFIVQIIGPPCVKFAVSRAGEVGRNITEEDLINSYRVDDQMNISAPVFEQSHRVDEILRDFAKNDVSFVTITDGEGRIAGTIGFDDLRQCLDDSGMGQWLVAYDVMQPAPTPLTGDIPLAEASHLMAQQDVEALPVADGQGHYLGLLELRAVRRAIRQELIHRRDGADLANLPAS